MRDPTSRQLSRRSFLGASAVVLGAAALEACTPSAQPENKPAAAPPAATSAPAAPAAAGAATSAPAAANPTEAAKPAAAAPAASSGGPKSIKTLVDQTWAELGMNDATTAYNEAMKGKVQVELESGAAGWEPKALAMIKDKSIPWSAHGYAPFFNQYNYVKSGMAAPIDDLVKASPTPYAKDMKGTYYAPNIDDVNHFEGKLYFVPMKLNIHLLGYRSDYLKKAGIDKIPDNWDDFEKALGEVKKATAADQVIPFAIRKEFYRTVGTSFVTRKQQIWDDKGVINLDVPEFYDTINMYNRWFQSGLVTNDSFIAAADTTIWEKGKVFAGIDSHSWIRTAKKIWGNENVAGSLPPQNGKTDKPRTWMHVDSGFVFQGAPEPQAGADWLLTVLGPDGDPADKWWPKVITFSGSPVHKTMFDKYVVKNTDYPEIADSYKAIPNSIIMPVAVGASYPAIQAKVWPWLERFWAGEIGDKEAVTGAMKEIKEEIEKSLPR